MTNTYSYPPSNHLMKYGELVPNSNFYCEGVLFLTENKKVKCNFEVGYTIYGKVTVVCYFQSEHSLTKAQIPRYDHPIKLLGRDLRHNFTVCIEFLSLRNHSIEFTTDTATVHYIANCFKAYIPEQDLVKIPLEKYRKGHPYYEITGIEFPKWFTNKYDKEEHEVSNFVFEIADQYSLSLNFVRYHSDKEYENQPTGGLVLNFEDLPSDLSTDDIVNYWCCLMSLAIGKDIHWVVFGINAYFLTVSYIEKTWQRQYLHGDSSFYGLLSNHLLGIDIWKKLSEFVKIGFTPLLSGEMSSEECQILIQLMRQYIDYRLAETMTAEGEMRLITTLTEQFLYTWEKAKNTTSPSIISKDERNKLEELMSNFLEKNKDEFLTESLANFDEISEKLIGEIHKNIRIKTFSERVRHFFEYYSFSLLPDITLKKRIKAFILTRNSIAHDGVFAHLNDRYKTRKLVSFGSNTEPMYQVGYEIANVRMMMPLMIMAMIGYTGEFEDLLGKEWQ